MRVVTVGEDGIVDGDKDEAVYTIYGRTLRDKFPESLTSCLSGINVLDPPWDRTDSSIVYILDTCHGMLIEQRQAQAVR